MNKHTPGPWVYSGLNNKADVSATIFSGKTGDLVGSIITSQANANLIAAAPDLLSALRDIMAIETGPWVIGYQHLEKKARAAIAKAEGNK